MLIGEAKLFGDPQGAECARASDAVDLQAGHPSSLDHIHHTRQSACSACFARFGAETIMASAHGRVVLLTGAAGGIGVSMTDALLAAGHRVAAVDRDAKALDRLSARH